MCKEGSRINLYLKTMSHRISHLFTYYVSQNRGVRRPILPPPKKQADKEYIFDAGFKTKHCQRHNRNTTLRNNSLRNPHFTDAHLKDGRKSRNLTLWKDQSTETQFTDTQVTDAQGMHTKEDTIIGNPNVGWPKHRKPKNRREKKLETVEDALHI